jgi:hypothetical protein
MTGRRKTECGVPQGSPCSPVLFALMLAKALAKLPDGVSYVDDCTWCVSFTSQREFKETARTLLDQVHDRLSEAGFAMDEGKTEVAWIFAGPKPSTATRKKAEGWNLKWKVPRSDQVSQSKVQHQSQAGEMARLLPRPEVQLAGARQTPPSAGTPQDQDSSSGHGRQRHSPQAGQESSLGGGHVHGSVRG